MTPYDKAKELVDKMEYKAMIHDCFGSEYLVAKDCALIAVDEILNMSKIASIRRDEIYMELEFFIEVKQEIKKL
jgi:hypothetical protein